VELRVSNGARVAALAVRTYNLTLPSRMLLELDNFYFVPVLEEIKPNGSKWVFKRKTNMKDNVQIYNASFKK